MTNREIAEKMVQDAKDMAAEGQRRLDEPDQVKIKAGDYGRVPNTLRIKGWQSVVADPKNLDPEDGYWLHADDGSDACDYDSISGKKIIDRGNFIDDLKARS